MVTQQSAAANTGSHSCAVRLAMMPATAAVVAAADIADERRRYGRTIGRAGGEREEPGGGDVVEVVAGFVAARPVLTVARNGAIDDAGIHGFHGFVAQPEPRHDARTELLDHDVAASKKRHKPRVGVGCFEIEHDALLAAIEQGIDAAFSVDIWRITPQLLAARPPSLDDLGARL